MIRRGVSSRVFYTCGFCWGENCYAAWEFIDSVQSPEELDPSETVSLDVVVGWKVRSYIKKRPVFDVLFEAKCFEHEHSWRGGLRSV